MLFLVPWLQLVKCVHCMLAIVGWWEPKTPKQEPKTPWEPDTPLWEPQTPSREPKTPFREKKHHGNHKHHSGNWMHPTRELKDYLLMLRRHGKWLFCGVGSFRAEGVDSTGKDALQEGHENFFPKQIERWVRCWQCSPKAKKATLHQTNRFCKCRQKQYCKKYNSCCKKQTCMLVDTVMGGGSWTGSHR